MSLDEDLERIAHQEARLVFQSFSADTAWLLGSRLRASAEARQAAIAMDIQGYGQPLFFAALAGATPDNIEWIRRKRNVVMRFQRSSYAVGLQMKKQGTSLLERSGLEVRDYAAAGGGFPIKLQGGGCVGAITISGLPQRSDHELIVEVLADLLGQPYLELALERAAP